MTSDFSFQHIFFYIKKIRNDLSHCLFGMSLLKRFIVIASFPIVNFFFNV